MSQSKGQLERDCTEKCKSTQHGDNICSVITKRSVTDAELCAYLRWICCTNGQVSDSLGRTALHFASSCGRTKLLKWLIKARGAQINGKDLESGYTALHRSIFYGKINAAVTLIKLGANCNLLDHNDLTPLEHAIKDRVISAQYTLSSVCQAYVWGTNTNYTLGTGLQQARQLPDLNDAFHRKYTDVSVAQICMAKFHCVIVSRDGRVFSCGHGHGGRLGLNSENTVIIPQELQFNASGLQFSCAQASIGRDHSIFLSETGQIWSCGLNTHHVLGIKPPPPQILVPRPLSEFRHSIKGVCTGRFHSVAWGTNALYTWGLHAGHLGHDPSPNTTYVTPKLVANFSNNQETEIISVAASDGATVVSTKKGDVFVLHEYQCRRIASRQLNIEKLVVVGGHLNSKLSNDILIKNGGNELKVLVLQTTGNILLWQESWPQLSRCIYTLNRPLTIRDVVLSHRELFFVTDDGEAFKGEFRARKKKLQQNVTSVPKTAFHEFLDKDECQVVKVHKFPHIHRAVKIHCDSKGLNFGVIQNTPQFLLFDIPEVSSSTMVEDMLNLLNNSDEMDSIHDVVFKVSTQLFPVHRYIIALKSEPLNSLIESNTTENTVELTNIHPILFKQILIYIYTGTCDILTCGECSMEIKNLCKNSTSNKLNEEFIEIDENISAFEYYNKKSVKKKGKSKDIQMVDESKNPVRLLQQAAKRFGIKSLHKILDNFSYVDGFIQVKTVKTIPNETNKFDKSMFKNLHDVIIKSKSGAEIAAHKCILAARLEYFNNLFAVRWNENSKRSVISLPISYNILETVITFLYTDDAKDLKNSDDIDHLSSVLIISDQLFITRLKEICEVALSGLLTLRNAANMLQFASIYNATQLKNCVMEFISLNLSAMLESKILECLDEDILNELTNYYCKWNGILSKRVITPFSDAPSDEQVKNVSDLFPVNIEDSDLENFERKTGKLNNSRKKVSNRKSCRISESSLDSSFEETNTSFQKLEVAETSENKTTDDNKWIKIFPGKEKYQKVVQARLKSIAIAMEKNEVEKPSNCNFAKLVPTPRAIPKMELASSEIIKSPQFNEIPINKVQKLSQKQRKKLIAEESDKLNKKPSWNSILWSKENNSFTDIIKGERESTSKDELNTISPKSPWQKVEVPSPMGSPDTQQKFLDIVAGEKKQKENWAKMRARPLFYTVMEDKAISELERFYNIHQVSDEYITIHKVEKEMFAAPLWVHSNSKH